VSLIDDYQDNAEEDARVEDRARLDRLFALADEAIDDGYDVLPAAVWLKPDGTLGKAPLLVRGHLEAHHDRQLIREQIINPHVSPKVPSEYEVVIGIVPGSAGRGLLDFDVKGGKLGRVVYEELVAEHGPFVRAAWHSPSGGRNVLFIKPPGATYSNVSPWSDRGVDVRVDSGWVVAPGNETSWGAWEWHPGHSYATAALLPTGITDQLKPSSTSGPKATNTETVRFIEASPTCSSPLAVEKFNAELEVLHRATTGSRHDALVHVMSWSFGMHALDLRDAVERIKAEWAVLTAGEGREDEVDEIACWVTGKEATKRAAAQTPPGVDPTTGEVATTRRRKLTSSSVAGIGMRRARWLWDERVPLGALTLLGGREGLGKSILACELVAQITTGKLPGEFFGQPKPVLIVATEDSYAHTIKPRLTVAGANVDLCRRVDVEEADGTIGKPTLPHDIEGLGEEVQRTGAVAVLLDPIISRLDASLDTHRDAEVRQGLEPLVATAEAGEFSIIGLIHVNKGTSNDPLTMLMASRAFAGVARAVLFATLDSEQPGMRLLGQPKNNLGRTDLDTLMFGVDSQVAGVDVVDGTQVTAGKLRWCGVSQRTILDAIHDATRSPQAKSQAQEAEDWLTDWLSAEQVADSKDVKAAAKEAGHSERTLHRVREQIGAGVTSVGFPRRTVWSTPGLTPDEVEQVLASRAKPPVADDPEPPKAFVLQQ
jgi:AAA domain/Bifunctional DNA primase/polymerase, N-terminal